MATVLQTKLPLQKYRDLKVAIIASGLFTEGGDWRSIYFYARSMEARGERVALINPCGRRGLRQLLAAGTYAPRLIVNGLGTLSKWRVLLVCLLRRDVRIYLHETGFILDQFQKESPLRYPLVSRVLRSNPVLCVSRQAEAHYRSRFGTARTDVVYECPGAGDSVNLDPKKIHVVMVGSINERKGVALFSKVADLAATCHADWAFHWIGGLATMEPIGKSTNVTWHGWHWSPSDIVRQCDVFFLSSIDDPCPLSAIEALQSGKCCVAYKETGAAELIADIPGCTVFHEYTVKAAIEALEQAVNSGPGDPSVIAGSIDKKASVRAFARAIDSSLS